MKRHLANCLLVVQCLLLLANFLGFVWSRL